jgi:hypothetical protein
MRSKLRKRAPIGGDHYDVARSFLDAWLGELEMATFRQVQKANPEISSDLLEIFSEVTDDDDGRWIWIAIGYSLRFVVEKRTGLIYEVDDLRINKDLCYGELRFWDLNWPGFLPA